MIKTNPHWHETIRARHFLRAAEKLRRPNPPMSPWEWWRWLLLSDTYVHASGLGSDWETRNRVGTCIKTQALQKGHGVWVKG